MLCQTITHTLLQLVQALWERAAQAFDIIGLVDTLSCVRECSLRLLLHVIKAASLKRMLLQKVRVWMQCVARGMQKQLGIIKKALQASSQVLRRQPRTLGIWLWSFYSALLRAPHKLLAHAMKTAE